MADDKSAIQEQQWLVLHDRITEVLDRFGRKDAFGKGDYWLVDDNWGWYRQQVEIQNLDLLKPQVVRRLQAVLAEYPDWDITVRVDVPGTEERWPGMGLVIYHDEIVDELRREFLPAEFGEIRYA